MRLLAKFLVFLLSLFGAITVIFYFYGYSVTFPFSISEDLYVPEHRLHAIRLGTFTTFVYFGFRYLFFGSTKLHPIQFLLLKLIIQTQLGSREFLMIILLLGL